MIDTFVASLPNVVVAIVVFILFFFLARGVKALVQRVADRSRRHHNLGLVLGRLAQWLVVLLGALIAMVIVFPNFSPAQLIQLLGISSVAIGFAFRDILQNFLAGILLLITEPFRIGDQIVMGEFEGTVEDIQTRATMIRTYDGRRVVIPNANLFTNAVVVNTAFPKRRSQYDVGIGYGDDVERARALMLEAMREVESVSEEPAPDVRVVELADSSVLLRARWWSESTRSEVISQQDQVLTAIKHKLQSNGVDLPFPTQVLLFHDQTEETDGDRRRQREGWPAGPGEAPQPMKIASALREANHREVAQPVTAER